MPDQPLKMSERAKGATRTLARFVAHLRYEDLPPEVVAHTRLLALDAIGCCLYGSTLPWTQKLIGMVREEGGHPRATVVNGGFRTSASQAVLVNSSACHAFEADDTHKPSFFHPGSIALPVALACAEHAGTGTGRDILAAMVAGYEVGTRVGMGATMGLFLRGWHPQGTTGTFVAGASAAHLLKLKEAETLNALGVAGTQASGLMSAQEGAMVKRMHSGRAAQSGVYAALLARRGYTGVADIVETDFGGFLTTLSDRHEPERVTRELGQEWETLAVGFKPYASVASMHAALYSLREIMREHALTADDISSIHAGVHRMTHVHCAWDYQAHDVTEAQMNLFYGLAVMAVDGDAFIEQYREERLRDPRILAVIQRCSASIDAGIMALGDAFRHAVKLTVTTRDGRTLTREMWYSPGSPDHPLKPEEIVRKFETMAAHALSTSDIAAMVELTLNLERLEDMTVFMRVLARARPVV